MIPMSKNNKKQFEISVISPVYGTDLNLWELCKRIVTTIEKIDVSFEIILINDASPDNSWEVITQLSDEDPRIKGINLSRNFGQHSAITAGLDLANGRWTVVMDCDLQDQPEEIENLYKAITSDIDMVLAKKKVRKDSWSKIITSKLFYRVLKSLSGITHDTHVSSFGIYSREVIDAVLSYRERFRSFGLLVHLVGYKRKSIEVDHGNRESNASGYTFFSRLDLAINSIIAHSDKPLKVSITIGVIATTLALAYAAYLILAFFLYELPMSGFTTIIVSMFLLFGLHFILLGVVGLYVGRVFDETKRRPLYHISAFTKNTFSTEKGRSRDA